MLPEFNDVDRIFRASWIQRAEELASSGSLFVHYTSAENLMRILRGKEFWLRNSTLMNDSSETWHGYECLRAAIQSEVGQRFTRFVEFVFPDAMKTILRFFESERYAIHFSTYLGCLSEHGPSLVDAKSAAGLLSMWRAYAPRDGVAIAFDTSNFMNDIDELNTLISPVEYVEREDFQQTFVDFVQRLYSNENAVRRLDRANFEIEILAFFRTLICSTKHPIFREEREWRIIA